MADSAFSKHVLNFNVDRYLNPFVPANQSSRLPRPISHFLGVRPKGAPTEPSVPVQWLSAFLATIAGLCAVAATYTHAPGLDKYHPPVLIASLGATAVLDYNSIRSPLAQPRNAVLGHVVSAIVGVAVSKLFQLSSHFEGGDLVWVSAALGCGAASVVMSMTGTVHPPGGATAVLASSDAGVRALGWIFVPVVMVGALIMLGVALLGNNIVRQYPVYWWVAGEVGGKLPTALQSESARETKKNDEEAAKEQKQSADARIEDTDGGKLAKKVSSTDSDRTLNHKLSTSEEKTIATSEDSGILISASSFQVPSHLNLSDEERKLLQSLQVRLGKSAPK